MQLSAASDYSNLSDSELDAAYEAVYNTFTAATGRDKLAASIEMDAIAQVILSKIGGVVGFMRGAAGGTRFPRYDAIQGKLGRLQQVKAARESIAESAKNVAGDILSSTIGKIGIAAVLGFIGLQLLRRK